RVTRRVESILSDVGCRALRSVRQQLHASRRSFGTDLVAFYVTPRHSVCSHSHHPNCRQAARTQFDSQGTDQHQKERIMRIRTRLLPAIAIMLALGGIANADFKGNLDWCIGNHTVDPGQTNCPGDYAATYPECLTGGGRACLMTKAIDSAKANDCNN